MTESVCGLRAPQRGWTWPTSESSALRIRPSASRSTPPETPGPGATPPSPPAPRRRRTTAAPPPAAAVTRSPAPPAAPAPPPSAAPATASPTRASVRDSFRMSTTSRGGLGSIRMRRQSRLSCAPRCALNSPGASVSSGGSILPREVGHISGRVVWGVPHWSGMTPLLAHLRRTRQFPRKSCPSAAPFGGHTS
jgi:hypothetical protein